MGSVHLKVQPVKTQTSFAVLDVLKVLGGEERLWRDMGMVLLRWEGSAHGQGAVGAGDKQGQWGLREGTRCQYRRLP